MTGCPFCSWTGQDRPALAFHLDDCAELALARYRHFERVEQTQRERKEAIEHGK